MCGECVLFFLFFFFGGGGVMGLRACVRSLLRLCVCAHAHMRFHANVYVPACALSRVGDCTN